MLPSVQSGAEFLYFLSSDAATLSEPDPLLTEANVTNGLLLKLRQLLDCQIRLVLQGKSELVESMVDGSAKESNLDQSFRKFNDILVRCERFRSCSLPGIFMLYNNYSLALTKI